MTCGELRESELCVCVCVFVCVFFLTWRVPCVRRHTPSARSCTRLLYSLSEEQTAPESREISHEISHAHRKSASGGGSGSCVWMDGHLTLARVRLL